MEVRTVEGVPGASADRGYSDRCAACEAAGDSDCGGAQSGHLLSVGTACAALRPADAAGAAGDHRAGLDRDGADTKSVCWGADGAGIRGRLSGILVAIQSDAGQREAIVVPDGPGRG